MRETNASAGIRLDDGLEALLAMMQSRSLDELDQNAAGFARCWVLRECLEPHSTPTRRAVELTKRGIGATDSLTASRTAAFGEACVASWRELTAPAHRSRS